MEQKIRSNLWTNIESRVGLLCLLVGCALLANAALWTMPLNPVGRWILVGAVFSTFAVAFLAGRQSRSQRPEDEKRDEERLAGLRARGRYDALRTRLQPHFLFNTLHTISALIHIDRDRAESLVLALSDVLRSTLVEQKSEVTLDSELNLLRKYLEIEWTRFNDRLELDIAVDPKALSCLVPPFLLQPLVEYAVRTGVERRTEPSLIQLVLELKSDTLRIEVGHQYCEERIRHSRKSTVSLEEIESRLQLIYGSRQEMRIQKDLGGWQSIVIKLPNRTEHLGENSCA